MNPLEIAGYRVATAIVGARYRLGRPILRVELHLFRAPTWWTLVTFHINEPDAESVRPSRITATVFDTLDELAAHIDREYDEATWLELLDGGHEHDDDLHDAWAPTRIERDLDDLSIFNADLSEGGLLAPTHDAPGRQLDGWDTEALNAMAERIDTAGYKIMATRRGAGTANVFGSPPVGELDLYRWGQHFTATVRVDANGEIFARLNHDDEVEPR